MPGETIPDYLSAAARIAWAKGEHPACALRTTREVAEHFGIKTSNARDALNAAWARGEIECYAARPGHPALHWGLKGVKTSSGAPLRTKER